MSSDGTREDARSDRTRDLDLPVSSGRGVGAGASLVTVSQVATAVAAGATGVLIARLLGPDGAGHYTLMLSVLGLALVVSTLGIEYGLTYFVTRDEWSPGEALPQVVLAAWGLGLTGVVVGGVAVALAADSVFAGISTAELGLVLAALPWAISTVYLSYLALALNHYGVYALAPAAPAVAALVLSAVLAPLFGLTGAAAGIFVAQVATGLGMALWAARAMGARPAKWLMHASTQLRRAVGFGIKANLSNVLQQLNYRADVLILAAVAGGATVGHYSVALAVAHAGLILPRALSAVLFPRVAATDARAGTPELRALLARTVRHGFLLAGVTATAIAAVLPAIPLVYGGGFGESVELGYILVPGIAAMALGNVLAAAVVGTGEPRFALYNTAIVTPVTLVLYAMLIPTLDAYGAAIGSTISYVITGVLWWFYFCRVTGLRGWRMAIPTRAEVEDYRTLARRLSSTWR